MDYIWEELGLPGFGHLVKEDISEFWKYAVSIEQSIEIYVYFYVQESITEQHTPIL